MSTELHQSLLEKSVDACIAAIEIYNKPDFRYREEAFAILMLNAWELILKARIIKENNGSSRPIEVWEKLAGEPGSATRELRPKTNRTGNVVTIGLTKATEVVRQYETHGIDQRCAENLDLLTVIRDNAIHLSNFGPGLGKRVQEVGTAALRNFARAAENWFGFDLSRFNFYLMPLTFHSSDAIAESLARRDMTVPARMIMDCIDQAERDNPSDENADYNVTLQIQVRFVRSTSPESVPMRVTQDPEAPVVRILEEDVLKNFSWDYRTLLARLHERYVNFREDQKFHSIKKQLVDSEIGCRTRYLDPRSQKGSKKILYSPNIMHEFDKHYQKK